MLLFRVSLITVMFYSQGSPKRALCRPQLIQNTAKLRHLSIICLFYNPYTGLRMVTQRTVFKTLFTPWLRTEIHLRHVLALWTIQNPLGHAATVYRLSQESKQTWQVIILLSWNPGWNNIPSHIRQATTLKYVSSNLVYFNCVYLCTKM